MESSFGLLLVLLTLTIIHIVQAQDQQGIGYLLCSIYIHVLQTFLFSEVHWFSNG